MLAISRCEVDTVYQKTLGVNDFYFASDAWEYPMGSISLLSVMLTVTTLAAHAPIYRSRFYARHIAARHSLAFWVMSGRFARSEQPRNA